jgi:hypothetical protein
MSSKQDRQGVRTATDIERKYNLKWEKPFAELMGVSKDTRQSVDRVESELRSDIEVQVTSITRDTERIIMAALESYVETEDHDSFRQTVESELSVMAEKISMNFSTTTEQVTDINGDLQTVVEILQKHFDFSANGLSIKAGEHEVKLVLDNNVVYFELNGQRKTTLDKDSLKTGNIYVDLNERAQFGNFAFVPRSNGSLDFLKVGG